ncbi:MAG: hypothetical protein OK436_00155 [Thaumarchaeota archaeon]|nr:hypothetical protein [Nitrososphaerota archaeon]
MSKPKKSPGILEESVRVVFLILIGFIGLVFTQNFFALFFIPIVGWLIWATRDKTSNLERRVAALEKPSDVKSEES